MGKERKKVAIIGAGIFGANIAYDLAEDFEVTMYERQSGVLTEGSFVNQYRHHIGYHYPRSPETVFDIQDSTETFENRFSEALANKVATYYGVAKEGSLVSSEEFLRFCDQHNLPYQEEKPPENGFSDLVDLSIRVPERSYNFNVLKEIVEKLLAERSDHISSHFDTEVTNCEILDSGRKKITFLKNNEEVSDEFDFVINATYARINTFTRWLGLEPYPVRVDLAEVLIVTIPGPTISLTVMDGPFATLMPTGNPDEYTLYHAKHSILDRYAPDNGLVKEVKDSVSQADLIYLESLKLFPILKQATVVENRIVHRGVLAGHEHDDARVADIVIHGSGCWSVLSGKIVSAVKTSHRLTELLKKELSQNS